MKKLILCILLCIIVTTAAMAQTSVISEVTAFYAYGVAGEVQILTDNEIEANQIDGLYGFKKNGYYVCGNIELISAYNTCFDLYMKLYTKIRPGAPYYPLQVGYSSKQNFGVSLDSLYARMEVLNYILAGMNKDITDFMLHIKAGKYKLEADDFSVSQYGLESAINMIETSNSPGVSLAFSYSSFMLELASHGMFDEAIERLYDTDGGYSDHGKEVVGEFATQLFATARLLDYVFPFGIFSADASYAFNGAGIYSGHLAGGSVRLDTTLIPDILILPLCLSFAFYEKNIDTLGATAVKENSPSENSIDFRNTIRAGFAVGAQYIFPSPDGEGEGKFPPFTAELTIAGSFTYIEHIYRDPLSLFGLCTDTRITLDEKFYIGGGVILGTLADAVWQTSEGVDRDDYLFTFSPAENIGYEIYAGLNVPDIGRISLGFVNNRGLAMNYELESIEDGLIKHKQPGTELADKLWQTCALYIKFTGKI